MAEGLLDVGGLVIAPELLAIERAKATASLLIRNGLDYARLLECRRRLEGQEEILVLEVDIQRPQRRIHDMRATEPLAIIFFKDDRRPDVVSLRGDFPQVPHLNLSLTEYPKSLCLYAQDWSELKARWTGARFVERIRFWFAETARGTLHKEDQPLEPLIVGSGYQMVVPHDLFAKAKENAVQPLIVTLAGDDDKSRVLLATRPTGHERAGLPFIAVAVTTQPQTHGVIRNAPGTLNELHGFLAAAGCDLLGKLRGATDLWASPAFLQSKLIIVAACPKRRGEATSVESTDVWTFLTTKSVAEVLASIGRRASGGGYILGKATAQEQGQTIPLEVVRTTFSFSRAAAARLNGQAAATDEKILAIGLGALGSKLQMSLARAGFGKWTLVDEDVLLPHNLARHQYSGVWVGRKKAEIAGAANLSLFSDEPPPEIIVANVLRPGKDADRLSKAMAEADVILDMSASVTVARHVAAAKSGARRICTFFNPAGTELVLLAEDQGRTVSLDALEFQFYRGVITQPELQGHLATSNGRIRYGASCRDISSVVPDDQVSLLAAVGAHGVHMAIVPR